MDMDRDSDFWLAEAVYISPFLGITWPLIESREIFNQEINKAGRKISKISHGHELSETNCSWKTEKTQWKRNSIHFVLSDFCACNQKLLEILGQIMAEGQYFLTEVRAMK